MLLLLLLLLTNIVPTTANQVCSGALWHGLGFRAWGVKGKGASPGSQSHCHSELGCILIKEWQLQSLWELPGG
jgi:hypothetical protein